MVSAGGLLVASVALVALQRLGELRLARRNTIRARARGGLEFGASHYPAIVALHTAWLICWPFEAWLRGPRLADLAPVWLALFLGAQLLRYAAIASLGARWNTRIVVIPGAPPVRRGPYRVLNHPNYVAVVVELAALPLVFAAHVTAAIVGALNLALLLRVRIPAETRALAWAAGEERAWRASV